MLESSSNPLKTRIEA